MKAASLDPTAAAGRSPAIGKPSAPPSPLTATVPLRFIGGGDRPEAGDARSRSSTDAPQLPSQLEVLKPVTALAIRAAISLAAPSFSFELVVRGKKFAGNQEWPPGAVVDVAPSLRAGMHLSQAEARASILKHMGLPVGLAAELDKLAEQLGDGTWGTKPGSRPEVMLVPVPVGPNGPELPPALLEQLMRQQPVAAAGSGAGAAGPAPPPNLGGAGARPNSPTAADPREQMQRRHDELRARAAEDAKAKSSNLRMTRKLEMLRQRRDALKAKKRRVFARSAAGTAPNSARSSSTTNGGRTKRAAGSEIMPARPCNPSKPATGMAGLRRGFLL